jgi:predicted RNA binding protein YcfA (HicA-like mRNA interferase family)
MTSKGQKLLEKMRNSKKGWKRIDLDHLYKSFGFVIQHGRSHDIVKHPDYPRLRTTLPRHDPLAKGYVEETIKLIEELVKLNSQQRKANQEDINGNQQ